MIATAKDEDAQKSGNAWHWKLFGVACIFTTAWMYSLTIVFSRIMKDVHFSLLMFHYGWIASVSLIVGLVMEHVIVHASFDFANLRMFSYTNGQYSQLVILSLLNAFGMNLATIASQYEKSSPFIALLTQMTVFYGFLADVSYF